VPGGLPASPRLSQRRRGPPRGSRPDPVAGGNSGTDYRVPVHPTLAYLPSPHDGVWHLGPIPIRAYALCIIAGILLAVWIGERRWVARGGRRGTVSDIAVWAVVFGLVGGRLYHVLTDPELYFGAGRHPIDALKVWQGGLGIWGAIALGGVGAWIGCRRRGIKLPPYADAAAPGIAVAQAVGRWGNWFNQELFGRPTTLPWGLEIDPGRPNTVPGAQAYHPTFLYESLWDLGLAGVLVWVDRRFRLGRGRVFALYVMGYTAGRVWIEALRIDTANHVFGLRLNIWTSVLVFAGALVYFLRHPGPRETEVEPVSAVAAADEQAEAETAPADGAADTTEISAAEPAAAEPSAAEPSAAESSAAEPASAEPAAAESSAAEPAADEKPASADAEPAPADAGEPSATPSGQPAMADSDGEPAQEVAVAEPAGEAADSAPDPASAEPEQAAEDGPALAPAEPAGSAAVEPAPGESRPDAAGAEPESTAEDGVPNATATGRPTAEPPPSGPSIPAPSASEPSASEGPVSESPPSEPSASEPSIPEPSASESPASESPASESPASESPVSESPGSRPTAAPTGADGTRTGGSGTVGGEADHPPRVGSTRGDES